MSFIFWASGEPLNYGNINNSSATMWLGYKIEKLGKKLEVFHLTCEGTVIAAPTLLCDGTQETNTDVEKRVRRLMIVTRESILFVIWFTLMICTF